MMEHVRDTRWGFCKFCRRLEPIDKLGNLIIHKIGASLAHGGNVCMGSNCEPGEQPVHDDGKQ